MLKKFIIGFIVGALMFSIIPVMAEGELSVVPNPFPVLIDGEVAEVEGYNINGYTFLKLADFGKAGLTVKFNETDKQIEISSTKKAVITPEPIPDKGDDVVSDVEKFEENGYQAIRKDGVVYYTLHSIMDSVGGLYQKGYSFHYDPDTKKCSLTYNYDYPAMSIDRAITIIEDVPYIVFEDRTYTPRNYYLNAILPETEKTRPKPELEPETEPGMEVPEETEEQGS